MAEKQWRWIGADGFEYTGSLETLGTALRDGRASPTSMVSGPTMDGWLPASDVPELALAEASLPAFRVEDDAPTMRDNPLPESLEPEPPAAEPEPAAARASSPRSSRTPLMVALAVVGLGLVLALGATVLVIASRTQGSTTVSSVADTPSLGAPSSSPAAARVLPPLSTRCVASRARRVSKPAYGKVPFEVAAVGKGRVAVGFARTVSQAELVVLAADTLAEQSKKLQPSKTPIIGAQPVVRGDSVELAVDTEESNLEGARSVIGVDPLRIGAAPMGIARRAGDSEPDVVWPLTEKDLTPVRVESHRSAGHFVTLRAGGQSGKVRAGWLAVNGDKTTELLTPELDATTVGTPVPVLGAQDALILVAAKPSEAAEFQIYAGKAKLGRVPERLTAIPLGDSSARIAPAAAALRDRGWLLQWTERVASGHVVKVRVVDDELAPVGDAVSVSPQGADAGQGRVWVEGDRAVSFFLVSTGESHELWAAPISCK